MSENKFSWGDPATSKNRDRQLANSGKIVRADLLPVYEEGSMSARTFDQYKTILQHNGAPDIFTHANYIMDAGCGGLTALIGMREEFGPHKILGGFDVVDIPHAKIKRLQTHDIVSGRSLLDKYHIEFYQGTYLDIGLTIPKGYDALVAIPSFNVFDWESSYPLEVLLTFYHGLNTKGMVQTLIQIPTDMYTIVNECFSYYGIPHEFIDGNPELLKSHALYPFGTIAKLGTLTLGPKI